MHRSTFLLIALFAISFISEAQTTISGSVKDQSTGEPLIGVNIVIQDKMVGTITDTDGNFKLETSSETPFTLIPKIQFGHGRGQGTVFRKIKERLLGGAFCFFANRSATPSASKPPTTPTTPPPRGSRPDPSILDFGYFDFAQHRFTIDNPQSAI